MYVVVLEVFCMKQGLNTYLLVTLKDSKRISCECLLFAWCVCSDFEVDYGLHQDLLNAVKARVFQKDKKIEYLSY